MLVDNRSVGGVGMLSDRPVRTTIPAKDIERAKQWYGEKLDLKPVRETPGGITYECGEGTAFDVYPSEFAGTGQQTVMGFLTRDLETDVEELKGRGVSFETYDLPGI